MRIAQMSVLLATLVATAPPRRRSLSNGRAAAS